MVLTIVKKEHTAKQDEARARRHRRRQMRAATIIQRVWRGGSWRLFFRRWVWYHGGLGCERYAAARWLFLYRDGPIARLGP